jgi:hypothetical protein
MLDVQHRGQHPSQHQPARLPSRTPTPRHCYSLPPQSLLFTDLRTLRGCLGSDALYRASPPAAVSLDLGPDSGINPSRRPLDVYCTSLPLLKLVAPAVFPFLSVIIVRFPLPQSVECDFLPIIYLFLPKQWFMSTSEL